MEPIRFTSNVLRVLAAMMSDASGQHYALALSKTAKVNVGSIYATLARLEKHQLVTSDLEAIDSAEAGRPPRRYYALTAKGFQVARSELQAAQQALSFGGISYA